MTCWSLLEARLMLGLIFLSASVERNAVFGEALYVYTCTLTIYEGSLSGTSFSYLITHTLNLI
jgi:hypothetical protein